MLKVHPKIQEVLNHDGHGTVLDGAIATGILDSSGEVLDVKGADLSSLNEDGVLNTEHLKPEDKGEYWNSIIGRVIFAKKVFTEADCESERELTLWHQLEMPFIYGAFEMFDSEDHSNAKAAASIIKHYHLRNLPVVIRYSIEGSVVTRSGNHLTKTIARRVAATIKPCNRSSYSSLVSLPKEQADEEVGSYVGKSEKYVSTFEMEYSPIIEDPIQIIKNALNNLKEMNKALTLGGSNAAPDTLTQGAVLAKEDLGSKFLKSQVLAAYRDWDKKKPFKEFLKHRLPDVDEGFLNKFTEMTGHFHLVKADPELVPDDYSEFRPLHDLVTKLPAGAKQFKGKNILPGEISLVAGPYKNSKLKLLYMDDSYVYVLPFKAGNQAEVKVNKIPRSLENKHYIIEKEPEVLSVPNYVHGDKHSDKDLTHFQEQKELIHGINLADEPFNKPITSTQSLISGDMAHGWYKSSTQKTGFIKPSVVYKNEELKDTDPNYLSTARREVIFHNLSKKFWQLGEFVPTTALFNHPDTKHEHSVMEIKPNTTHVHPKSTSHDTREMLVNLGNSGLLDKLAIMDIVMGNSDRNRFNYLLDNSDGKIHLVDNALIFNYNYEHIPAYLHDYHEFVRDNLVDAYMNPEAIKWLTSLNPFYLQSELLRNKVDPALVAKAVARLLSMQSEALIGKQSKGDILLAHQRFNFSPVKQEIS